MPPVDAQLVAHEGEGREGLARHHLPVARHLCLEAGAARFAEGRKRLEAAAPPIPSPLVSLCYLLAATATAYHTPAATDRHAML